MANTPKLPRITGQWGKYANRTTNIGTAVNQVNNGSGNTNAVQVGGINIATNGKTQINIFNGKPAPAPAPHPHGNVNYNGKWYNVPKNQWATPYMPMGSIWGGMNFGGCSGCSGDYHKPDAWDKFYAFANGPISGQVFGAAALGVTGGLTAGLGSAINSWVNGKNKTTGVTTTTTVAGTPVSQTYVSNGTVTGASTTVAQEFQKITGHNDLNSVQEFNKSVDSLKEPRKAFNTANNELTKATNKLQEKAADVFAKKSNVEGFEKDISTIEQQLSSAQDDNTRESLQKELEQTKTKLEKAKQALEKAKDELNTAENDYKAATEAKETAETNLIKAQQETAAKERKAREDIRKQNESKTDILYDQIA